MIDTSTQVEKHFHKVYKEFDSFYRERKNIFSRAIDYMFRRSMQMRFERVLAEAAPYEGMSVLDAGCGTGRYSIALALKGIQRALGIDFARNMIGAANNLARQFKVDHICRFLKADFMQVQEGERFDHVIAMGVLDYIADPVPFVKGMVGKAQKKVMISFPAAGGVLQRLRKFKFEKLKKCPVFFYTEAEVQRIAQEAAGDNKFTIDKMAKDYFLVIFCYKEEESSIERQLTVMASDPAIRKELKKINQEFAVAELDGLFF